MKIGGDRDTSTCLEVKLEDQNTSHCAGTCDDQGQAIVDRDDGGLISGGQVTHHSHQEHRHVQHGRDPQGDLLPGVTGCAEDKQGDDVDEDSREDVVDQVES